MLRCYICHPLRGSAPHTEEKVKQNIQAVTEICQDISESSKVIPFSPIHAFAYMDPLEESTSQAMERCLVLLSVCDELWLFGDWATSEGCVMEVKYAMEHGIRIVPDRMRAIRLSELKNEHI